MADQITRDQVVEEARKLIGVPWIHQGRSRKWGIDCIGLLMLTAKACGIELVDRNDYSYRPDGTTLVQSLREQLEEKPIDQILPSDIVVFWIQRETLPQHIGIWTSNPKFIGDDVVEDGVGVLHTFSDWDKVVESPIDKRWRKRICHVFKFPGVVD